MVEKLNFYTVIVIVYSVMLCKRCNELTFTPGTTKICLKCYNLSRIRINECDEFGKNIDDPFDNTNVHKYDTCVTCLSTYLSKYQKRSYSIYSGSIVRCRNCSIYRNERTNIYDAKLVELLLGKLNTTDNHTIKYTKEKICEEFIPQLTLSHPDDEFPYSVCYRKYYV